MKFKILTLMLLLLATECFGVENAAPVQSYISQDNNYTNLVLGVSVIKASGWTFISARERALAVESSDVKNADFNAFVSTHMTRPFVIMTKERALSPQPTITALIAPLNSRMTTDAVANLQSMAAAGTKGFEDYRIVETPHNIEIGGCQGAYCKAVYTAHLDEVTTPVSFESWLIVSGDYYFLIGAVSREPEDDKTASEIKQTITSFIIPSRLPIRPVSKPRMLAHIFQDGENMMFISIIDIPGENNGVVSARGSKGNDHSFSVSHDQFEKLWTNLMSTEAVNYAGDSKSKRSFNGFDSYIFSAGYGPNASTNYVVPMTNASPALVKLANQFRAYAQ